MQVIFIEIILSEQLFHGPILAGLTPQMQLSKFPLKSFHRRIHSALGTSTDVHMKAPRCKHREIEHLEGTQQPNEFLLRNCH